MRRRRSSSRRSSFVVSPAAASQLVFGQQPVDSTAGFALNPAVTVKIEDPFGNVETSDNASSLSIAIASGPSGAVFGTGSTTTVTVNAGQATFSNLIFNTTGTYTLQASDASPSLTSSVSNSFVISPATSGGTTQLVFITQPIDGTAGVPLGTTVMVAIEDGFGNIHTSDNSTAITVFIASGPAGATFASGTFATINVVAGVADFSSLIFNTAGTYTLQASVGTATSLPSTSFIISPAAASKLVVTQQPSSTAVAGVNFVTQPVVQEQDQFGNVITSDSSSTVTVARGTHGTASLQGSPLTVTLTNGVATFSNLSYNVAQALNLAFTSSTVGVTSTTSSDILVSPAAASQIVFGQQPTSAIAGVAANPLVTVMIQDQFGNIETGDNTSTLTLSVLTGPSASFAGGSTTAVTVSGGVATFPVLILNTVGNYTLQAHDATPLFTSAPSSSFAITPAGANRLVVTQQPSSTATAGVNFGTQPIVAEVDAYGNIVTSDSASVITVTRGNHGTAALQGSSFSVTLVSGIATFSGLSYNVAESLNLAFSIDTAAFTTTSTDIVVSAAAAAKLAIVQQPSSTATAGGAFATQPIVQEQDQFGNVVLADSVHTVTAARGNLGTAALQGSTLTVTLVNGVATFSGLSYNIAETINLTFTSDIGGVTPTTSTNIAVSPTTASQLVMLRQPSSTATAGVAFATQPIVAEEDQFGNIITSDSSHTVTASRGLGTDTLLGSNLTITLVNGVASFSALLYDKAETINLDFTTDAGGVTSATSSSIVVSPGGGQSARPPHAAFEHRDRRRQLRHTADRRGGGCVRQRHRHRQHAPRDGGEHLGTAGLQGNGQHPARQRRRDIQRPVVQQGRDHHARVQHQRRGRRLRGLEQHRGLAGSGHSARRSSRSRPAPRRPVCHSPRSRSSPRKINLATSSPPTAPTRSPSPPAAARQRSREAR